MLDKTHEKKIAKRNQTGEIIKQTVVRSLSVGSFLSFFPLYLSYLPFWLSNLLTNLGAALSVGGIHCLHVHLKFFLNKLLVLMK